MFAVQRVRRCLLQQSSSAIARRPLAPIEVLTQLQLGITIPLSMQRGFLLEQCESQLEKRGITEAKLLAMDGHLCTQLLRQLVYEQYLAVPFRVFSFDMEFTAPPVFTAAGPTEDITELGLYSPARREGFASLVRPARGRRQGPGVTELTHITDDMLAAAPSFPEAWAGFVAFMQTPEPNELPGAAERILLLSHGGKLADVSLIKWTLDKFGLALPAGVVFGDTVHLIRDAHRRRPVTVDKHPPSWNLLDLVQWLHIPPTLPAHRAGNDAKMTWDALYHTLLRYGADDLTPREQLVPHFFDEEARRRLKLRSRPRHSLSGVTGEEEEEGEQDGAEMNYAAVDMPSSRALPSEEAAALLDVDFDDIFKEAERQGGSDGEDDGGSRAEPSETAAAGEQQQSPHEASEEVLAGAAKDRRGSGAAPDGAKQTRRRSRTTRKAAAATEGGTEVHI